MNTKTFSQIILPLMAILAILACDMSGAVTSIPEPTEIRTESGETQTADTPTVVVIDDATPTGTDPSCIILQDLNLRYGPGTAYRPPVKVLPANSSVTPLGFESQGTPSGLWAYVQEVNTQDEGWVSAGSQYISCNVDITELPAVAYDPPPPALPSTSQVSPGPGNCGKGGIELNNGDIYDCFVEFSEDYFIRFVILKNGIAITQNDGVQDVSFTVSNDDDTLYVNVEENASYCIFGGDAVCNSWVYEDNVYKWESQGTVVENGEYHIEISGLAIDSEGNTQSFDWQADVTVNL